MTRVGSALRAPTHVVTAILLIGGLIVAWAGAADAAGRCLKYNIVTDAEGNQRSVCVKYAPGEEGGGTGDGGDTGPVGPPPCTLEAPYDEFCQGTSACWGNNPAAVQDPKELKDVPKPSEDAHVQYKSCKRADGSTFDEWSWSTEDDGPSLADRVLTARGLLKVPVFTASFNPPVQTIVNLPTWWWAEGAPAGDIRGTPAFGLVAIATPNRMIVEPGDGSAAFTCSPISTTKSDECTYTYRRASNRAAGRTADGSPAYTAVVRLVYDVRYEDGGEIVDITGMDPTLSVMEGRSETTVPVREIQTLVNPNR